MYVLHGKVSAYRTCGRDGGTIGMFHFSKQSKQSEDFLNQRWKSVQWTTSLTETWRPALAAGRANNLWDLPWRATPFNCSTDTESNTCMHTSHVHSLTFTPTIKPSENHNFDALAWAVSSTDLYDYAISLWHVVCKNFKTPLGLHWNISTSAPEIYFIKRGV